MQTDPKEFFAPAQAERNREEVRSFLEGLLRPVFGQDWESVARSVEFREDLHLLCKEASPHKRAAILDHLKSRWLLRTLGEVEHRSVPSVSGETRSDLLSLTDRVSPQGQEIFIYRVRIESSRKSVAGSVELVVA